MAQLVLLAYVEPSSAAQEEAFNRWYDEVHIPQVVERITGVVGGTRYRLTDFQAVPEDARPTRRYLSIYDVDTDDLPALAERLFAAMDDGTVDMSDALDLVDNAPIVHFYEPV